jgi:uncharacterized repeat protein (TIGR01451 family)
MLAKKLLVVGLAIGILGAAGVASAQSDDGTPRTDDGKPRTIAQRLDKFGRTIFGGILPAEKPRSATTPKPSALATPQLDNRPLPRKSVQPDISENEPITSRSGNVLTKPGRPAVLADNPTLDPAELTPETAPLAVRRQVKETPESATASPTTPPLHERLSGFRESPFDSDDQNDPAEQPSVQPNAQPKVQPNAQPKVQPNIQPSVQPSVQPNVQPNVQPSVQPDVLPERTSNAPAQEKQKDSAPAVVYPPESRPIIAQRVTPAMRPAQPITGPASESTGSGSVVVESQPSAPQNSRPAGRSTADEVLIARKGPILNVETTGPRTINVGTESTYQVNMRNSGEVAADDLVLYVTVPEWTEVLGVNVSAGEAQMPETNRGGAIAWKVGHVDAKSQQRLTIRLVPRQNRPFDLGVRWEFKPIATQAMIEVQEPKLSLKLEGPREVQYGKKEIYRLKLSNTGNGNAENVLLVLTPVGAGDNLPASHKVGLLPAGEEKSLDVELTARQTGTLTIQAEARADNGVRTDLEEKVLVHRAALKLNVEGPRVQFVGSVANYVVHIRNTGTAPARNIRFTILLPNGARYLSGVEGIRRSNTQNKLEWVLESLGPNVEQNFTLKCVLGTPGTGKARVYTAADDDLMASAETTVQVDSLANLTMEVKDPTGPVPVGEEAVYELRVRNRGTREAQNVEVFAYFSRGIEPIGAEGAPNRLAPGQVVFQPLPSLPPGAEAVLRVRAKAEAAGNHVFRAEARCKPLNARLVSEATNLYYIDGPAETPAPQTAGDPPADQTPPTYDAMRVMPRSTPGDQTPAPPRK